MDKWYIDFIIQDVKKQECEESYKRVIVKHQTTINREVDASDLELILRCNDEFNGEFSDDLIHEIDIKNIVDACVKADMIKYYYVKSYKMNFTDRRGVIYLYYPKRYINF